MFAGKEDENTHGFTVLAFPCNQFGKQEPGKAEEVEERVCQLFSVTFPIMEKVDVNGTNTSDFYKFLRSECPGIFGTTSVKWNFTKFLIDHNGQVLKRFSPTTTPNKIIPEIKAAMRLKPAECETGAA